MPQSTFLFLIVDAIPWTVARRAWMLGALPGFPPPSSLISTFPSLTNVAIPSLLKSTLDVRPQGYEVLWFDSVKGDFSMSMDEGAVAEIATWPRPGMWAEAMLYALPRGFTWGQVRWAAREVLHHMEQPWIGWISGTDAVGHFKGQKALHEAFLEVCAAVNRVREEWRERAGGEPRIVLTSDHGLDFSVQSHLLTDDLISTLQLAGFSPRWEHPRGVAVVALGAVGSGVIHTRPEQASEVAETVCQSTGVDIAMARVEAGVEIFAVRDWGLAKALLRWEGEQLFYEPLTGDPLGLKHISGRWLSDAEAFVGTIDSIYPDALCRIRRAFVDLVQHPATVLFSMEQGWSFGPLATHAGATLVGGLVATHGSLRADQSTGFVLDSAGRLPPYVRISEVSSFLAGTLKPGEAIGAGIPWPSHTLPTRRRES